MAFKEELDGFINEDDFAVSATFNGETGEVILDMPDQLIGGGDVISTEYRITFKTGLFCGMGYDDTIVVDGDTYTVRTDPRKIDDGKFSEVGLSKV